MVIPLLDDILRIPGDLVEGTGDVARGLGRGASDIATDLVGGTKEAIDTLGDIARNAPSDIGRAIGDFQGNIFGGLFSSFGKALGLDPKILIAVGAVVLVVVILVVLKK